MNVVDSSGWLEYFADGPNADFFSEAIERRANRSGCQLYEVFKHVLRQRNEGDALRAVALMQQGRIVPLDVPLALMAARLSVALKLPMADSLILATARACDAALWTQDADFDGRRRLPGEGLIPWRLAEHARQGPDHDHPRHPCQPALQRQLPARCLLGRFPTMIAAS